MTDFIIGHFLRMKMFCSERNECHMSKFAEGCIHFLKKETVFCIAVLFALISAFFTPPNAAYISYIDWDTLSLLFSLMAVMKGFQKAGLFVFLGNGLLKKTATSRKMLLVLVFLPFVFSMVITNDVALITFVPFGLTVLRMARQERLAVRLVVLQTVAANLGSMLLPMGNPQNLYLYTKFGIRFEDLFHLMLPYVFVSGVCLFLLSIFVKSEPITQVTVSVHYGGGKDFLCYTMGFVLCLLGIFKLVSPIPIAGILAIFLFFFDKEVLASVDYSLLGTFVALFIFIGNIGCIDAFRSFLSDILANQVELAAIVSSQVISNVPTALLLSGFTTQWKELMIGCNLGGLGTLIASMASLISYKIIAQEYPWKRKGYLIWFTWINICLLGILLTAGFLFPA